MDGNGATGGGTDAVLRERRGDVLLVTLNRPDSLNAINAAMHLALSDAWSEADDPAIRAVVLTGAGRAFCAGADMWEARDPADDGHTTLRHSFHPHVLALAALAKPVIAAVNGPAAGSGLSIACAADIRIASTAAKFVPAWGDIGLVPDAGGSYFVTRSLGYSRSFAWLAGGAQWNAQRALDEGLVAEMVAPDALLGRAMALATALADRPGLSVGLTKQLLARAHRASLADQLEAEMIMQDRAIHDPGRTAARARKIEQIARETR